ncbi:MAG: branched-chain amino acid transport system ATP-binding protein livM [Baekduia sp.]|nr:branched-chain amino acid transport system ATP-binding protein livM [Baekduia sp.]
MTATILMAFDLNSWYLTYEHLIANTVIYSIASLALYFSFRCGVFNLSTAGVMSLGAYGTGILIVKSGWPTPVALLAGTVIGTVGGALVALPVIRLRGHFLAIATLGFAAVIQELAGSFTGLTGGSAGLLGITGTVGMPALLILLAIAVYAAFALRRHRVGRAWDAIRVDESAAAAAGVPVMQLKLLAFVVSTVLAALAGGLFAVANLVLVPQLFGFGLLTNLLVYTLLGGIANPLGPVAGASIISTMPSWLTAAGAYLDVVTGVLLILVVTYAPGGLVQLAGSTTRVVRGAAGRLRRRAPAPPSLATAAPGNAAAPSAEVVVPKPSAPPRKLMDADVEEAHLKIVDLAKHYGGVKSVDGVSLEIRPGETVALIGPNGAGKTTLLNCVSGLVRRTSGSVVVNGQRIDGWSPQRIAAEGRIRRTFQTPRVLPGMSVMANVLIGLHAEIAGGLGSALLRLPAGRRSEREARARAMTALEVVGLADVAGAIASDLPYGLQRRVELARALVANPSILLLDEPVAGLSTEEADALKEILRDVVRTTGCSVVFVDHNMPFVVDMADRIVVLNFGRLLTSGTAAEIQAHPQVIEAYLGGADHGVVPA